MKLPTCQPKVKTNVCPEQGTVLYNLLLFRNQDLLSHRSSQLKVSQGMFFGNKPRHVFWKYQNLNKFEQGHFKFVHSTCGRYLKIKVHIVKTVTIQLTWTFFQLFEGSIVTAVPDNFVIFRLYYWSRPILKQADV